MSNPTYFERIDALFEELEDKLDDLPADPDVASAEGVINVTFTNGVVFVFSRQPPTEQLWLATPGGGFHYEWDDARGDWIDTKTDDAFRDVVIREMAQHADVDFSWK